MNLTTWANQQVENLSNDAKSLIDCGMDMEDAIDAVFNSSTLANSYKMQVLSKVANYHHEHKFVIDIIAGKEWCATCQTFKS